MTRDYSHLIGNQFAKGNPPNQTSFKKGLVPWNKGLRGVHFSPETEFKKGQESLKKMPLGTITVRVDKGGAARSWIKIAHPREWIEYAKFVWMQHRGNIPDGLLIHHIDKNSMNDELVNLQLATRAEHINLHRGDLKRQKARLAQGVFNLKT